MERKTLDVISLGIPNKGPLYKGSLDLLERAGLQYSKPDRGYTAWSIFREDTLEGELLGLVKLSFGRPRDIVRRVARGQLDMGITGSDIIGESGLATDSLAKLGFAKCRLVMAVSKEFLAQKAKEYNPLILGDMRGLKVGTSYPKLTQKSLVNRQINVPVEFEEAEGAVEGMVAMGWVDAVTEIVETGRTLRDNGLVDKFTLGWFESELIADPAIRQKTPTGSLRFFFALTDRLSKAKKVQDP